MGATLYRGPLPDPPDDRDAREDLRLASLANADHLAVERDGDGERGILQTVGIPVSSARSWAASALNPRASAAASAAAARSSRLAFAFGFLPAYERFVTVPPSWPTGVETAAPCAFSSFFFFVTASAPATTAAPEGAPEVFRTRAATPRMASAVTRHRNIICTIIFCDFFHVAAGGREPSFIPFG